MDKTIKITDVNTRDIGMVWGSVNVLLQHAVDKNQGEFNLDDIYVSLLQGHMRLWLAYKERTGEVKSAAVCELRRFPLRNICYIILLAGDGFGEWSWAINSIEEWALDNGADAIAAYARRGFLKPMKDYGYTEVYSVIQKELTDRRLH